MVLQDWLASSLLPPDDLATAAVSPSLVSVLTTAAEELVNSMASDINSLAFKVTLIKNYMDMLERHRKLESADLLLLDCVTAKLQISLDKTRHSRMERRRLLAV